MQKCQSPGQIDFDTFKIKKKIFIDFRESEDGEREALICCSTYLCIHWLILGWVLTRIEPATLVYGNEALTN